MNNLRNGSKGAEVVMLQQNLAKLGYDVLADGNFGQKTEDAVKGFQSAFGYTIDGIVGEGTQGLIKAQLGYGWNAKLPNAKEIAQRAQGKGAPGGAPSNKDGGGARNNNNNMRK